MTEETVPCPICNLPFKKGNIEKHANKCLQFQKKEKPVTRTSKNEMSSSVERSSFFQCRKRQSSEKMIVSQSKKPCLEINEKIVSQSLSECKDDNSKQTIVNSQSSISKPDNKPLPMNSFQQEILKWSSQEKQNPVDQATQKKGNVAKVRENTSEGISVAKIDLCEKLPNKSTKDGTKNSGSETTKSRKKKITLGKIPLAEQMRPVSFDDYHGQKSIKTQKVLKELFNSNRIPSMILWGPPGCGKTSLVHVLSQRCKTGSLYRFVTLSATMSGVGDVKEAVKVAKNEKKLTNRKTVLFIDEVHRFNKIQQDTFLPHVEDGTIVLIGATTENPSFHVNNALLSRCRLVVLNQLENDSLERILKNAIERLGGWIKAIDDSADETYSFTVEDGFTGLLASYSNGDARIALNSLDMILQAKLSKGGETITHITCDEIKEEMKTNHLNYDRKGDEHFHMASALQKSIRGSSVDASLYWLARMLEGGETPLYIARRLVRCASEDIGLADPTALQHAVSAYQACHFIGMPECDVILAQTVVYLAQAPKSFSVCEAYFRIKETIKTWPGPQPSVPLHLRNAPTKLLKELGYSNGYQHASTEIEYLPKELCGTKFFKS